MDSEGKEIVGDTVDTKEVYEKDAARMMTEVLTGVIKYGTARGLGLSHTISAGKTGTTNDKKDGWFVGYTPYYTTSVWVGYDIPKSVYNLTGSSYPGHIWHNFMEELHNSSMTRKFEYYDWRGELKKAKEEKDQEQQKLTPTISPDPTQFNDTTDGDNADAGTGQDISGDTGSDDSQTDPNGSDDGSDTGDDTSVTDDTGDITGDGTDSSTGTDGSNSGDVNSNGDTQSGQTDTGDADGNTGN
jgi:membrane peptidoglycan carboxypeptidase